VTAYVNLRATADNSAAVVAVVPAGKAVDVVECKGWCEVRFDGQKGFIHKRFLKE
jgi:SH3-like domain-containing protein